MEVSQWGFAVAVCAALASACANNAGSGADTPVRTPGDVAPKANLEATFMSYAQLKKTDLVDFFVLREITREQRGDATITEWKPSHFQEDISLSFALDGGDMVKAASLRVLRSWLDGAEGQLNPLALDLIANFIATFRSTGNASRVLPYGKSAFNAIIDWKNVRIPAPDGGPASSPPAEVLPFLAVLGGSAQDFAVQMSGLGLEAHNVDEGTSRVFRVDVRALPE